MAVALPVGAEDFVVEEVGGTALPTDASKLSGMALVWRGWDLRRGEFCFGGEFWRHVASSGDVSCHGKTMTYVDVGRGK